jgi:hypothetical protein
VKSIHERVRLQIAQKNEKFASQANKGRRRVIFEPGDWVWVHMRKERFPAHRRTKLHPRGDDLRSNPFEEWGNDGPHGRPNLKDSLQVPDGPITRSRAKKIKEAMLGLVQSTWAEFANLSSKTPTFNMGFKEDDLILRIGKKSWTPRVI